MKRILALTVMVILLLNSFSNIPANAIQGEFNSSAVGWNRANLGIDSQVDFYAKFQISIISTTDYEMYNFHFGSSKSTAPLDDGYSLRIQKNTSDDKEVLARGSMMAAIYHNADNKACAGWNYFTPSEADAITAISLRKTGDFVRAEIDNNVVLCAMNTVMDGAFTFIETRKTAINLKVLSATAEIPVIGDINGDGIVSADDLVLAKKHLFQLNPTMYKDGFDLNNDSQRNIKDLIIIKKILSGNFPATRAWALSFNNNTIYDTVTPEKKKSIVFSPDSTHQYQHGASIQYFKGKFYAAFNSSSLSEDDVGQCVMLCSSNDAELWSQAGPLIEPPVSETGVKYTYQCSNLYVNDNEMGIYIVVYLWPKEVLEENGHRPYNTSHTMKKIKTMYMKTTDGVNWSNPIDCKIGGTSISLDTGRLIIPGIAFSDDLSGTNFLKAGMPDQKYAEADGIKLITEPHGFQTDDGIVNVLYRTDDNYMYGAQSSDCGETYTPLYKTRFKMDSSMFKFGRLSDGRYYAVCNPIPDSNRNPITLILSDDGINFNKWYTIEDDYVRRIFNDGYYKSGNYAYPCVIEKDGYLYVIYSMEKETIAATKINIESLDKVNFVKKTPDSEIFKNNLTKWKPSSGQWLVKLNRGYAVYPTVKNCITMSDTKVENGQSFTYEADIKYLGDVTRPIGVAQLIFGATASTQTVQNLDNERYYYLSLDLNNSFTRIFTIDKGELLRRGKVISFTDELKNLTDYHLKIDFNGKTKIADYYVNGKITDSVLLQEFSGGYFGLASYDQSFAFNNVFMEIK